MATGAYGDPGASAAGPVVEAHRAQAGGVTVLLQDQEATSAVGRQPRQKDATLEHVLVGTLYVIMEHVSAYTDHDHAPTSMLWPREKRL